MVSEASAATTVLRAAEHRRFIPLFSKPLLDEYRAVLSDPALVERFPHLTLQLVEVTIRRLRFIGDYVRTPKARFEYPRDPRDEKLIELAITLRATHIVSDDNDLLALPTSRTTAGRIFRQRLPNVEVLEAGNLLRSRGNSISFLPPQS